VRAEHCSVFVISDDAQRHSPKPYHTVAIDHYQRNDPGGCHTEQCADIALKMGDADVTFRWGPMRERFPRGGKPGSMTMRKHIFTAIAVALMTAAVAAPASAQPYGYGPGYGMMGGGYGYGPGMMQGYGGGNGPGGNGPGGMMGGYGPGYGPGPGMMGPGYGGGYGPGPGMMQGYGGGYGMGRGYYHAQGNLNLSADDVKNYLTRMIRNPNLKAGEIKEKDADTITADVVTKDKDGLVQRFEFNRHNGFYQPEQ
jgi:hypothetical protein